MWRQIQPLLQIYSILTTLIPVCVIVSHCDYIVNYYDDDEDDLPGRLLVPLEELAMALNHWKEECASLD